MSLDSVHTMIRIAKFVELESDYGDKYAFLENLKKNSGCGVGKLPSFVNAMALKFKPVRIRPLSGHW